MSNPVEIKAQDLSHRDSDSLSPRVIVNSMNEPFKKTYQFKEQPTIHRFLIDDTQMTSDDVMELKVFEQAIAFLASTTSAEDILKRTLIPPRQIQESNSVLVDIFDKKNPGFHTICLWKKTNQNFLIIDPSSYEYSSRLNKLLLPLLPRFEVTVKKYIDSKFYEALEKDKLGKEKQKNGNEINKNYRDCIDIAVKIAFSLNFSQQVAFDLYAVESHIDYLSNQKKVNNLLQGGMDAHIGWLQNADSTERDIAIRLLFENKDYLPSIKDTNNIEALRSLNSTRLKVLQSFDGQAIQQEFIDLIKETKKASNGLLTVRQFAECAQDWIEIFKIKNKLKERLKTITN